MRATAERCGDRDTGRPGSREPRVARCSASSKSSSGTSGGSDDGDIVSPDSMWQFGRFQSAQAALRATLAIRRRGHRKTLPSGRVSFGSPEPIAVSEGTADVAASTLGRGQRGDTRAALNLHAGLQQSQRRHAARRRTLRGSLSRAREWFSCWCTRRCPKDAAFAYRAVPGIPGWRGRRGAGRGGDVAEGSDKR